MAATKIRPGLAVKHFLLLFSTTFILFFLLSWINLRESREILTEKSLDEASHLLSKTNQYLDLYADSVSSLFVHLRFVEIEDSEALHYFAFDSAHIIKTLYFIPDEGKGKSSDQAYFDIWGDDFQSLGLDLKDIGKGLVWSEPHYSPLSGDTISFLKRFEDENRNEIGTAIIDIDLDFLSERVIGLADMAGITFHVTSRSDETILFDWNGPFGFLVQENSAMRSALIGVPLGTSEFARNDTNYYVIKSKTNTLGWHVYAFVDPKYFSEGLQVLNRTFATLGLLLLVLVLIASMVLSIIISRPVRKLAHTMDQVTSLHHFTPIVNPYQDELGELVGAYNNMMHRITNLTYEKNEFEWRMLQSQIGPHFLYNTLACINALAKRSRTAEITRTIESLIHLLRYSFDRSASDVPLEDEIKVLESYVAIQNIRYGDQFNLDVHARDDTLELLVPALLLQPVVENSIFHGFVPDSGSGTIDVEARRDDGFLKIKIMDKGKGMSAAELERLRESLRENGERSLERNTDASRGRMNAIGLKNIQQRIHVHYGEDFGLQVDSAPGAGTSVTLTLPAKSG